MMCASRVQQQPHRSHGNSSNTQCHSSVLRRRHSDHQKTTDTLNSFPWRSFSWLREINARVVKQDGDGSESVKCDLSEHTELVKSDCVSAAEDACFTDKQCCNVKACNGHDAASSHQCHNCLTELVTSDSSSAFQHSTETAVSLYDKPALHVRSDHRRLETADAVSHTHSAAFTDKCKGDIMDCDDEVKHEMKKSLSDSRSCTNAVSRSVKRCKEIDRRKRNANTLSSCVWMQQLRHCKVKCVKQRRTDDVDDKLRSMLDSAADCSKQHEHSSRTELNDVCSEREQSELHCAAADISDGIRMSDGSVIDSSSRVQLLSDGHKAVATTKTSEHHILSVNCSEDALSLKGCEAVTCTDSCKPAMSANSSESTVTATEANSSESTVTATEANSSESAVTATEANCSESAVAATEANSSESTVTATEANSSKSAVMATEANSSKSAVTVAETATCDDDAIVSDDDSLSSCGSDASVVSGPSHPHTVQVILCSYCTLCFCQTKHTRTTSSSYILYCLCVYSALSDCVP